MSFGDVIKMIVSYPFAVMIVAGLIGLWTLTTTRAVFLVLVLAAVIGFVVILEWAQ